MASDDVPPDDMHLFGLHRDPLDAALRGESDDPAVSALVQDLRAAYLPDGARPRSDALAAFTGTGDDAAVTAVAPSPSPRVEPVAEPAVPLGRRLTVGVAAFAATITGKIVLGGAVAAAALGGLHASEVVDVPLLPDTPPARTVPSTVPEMPELPDAVDLPPSAGPIEDRWTGTADRASELDRSEPARTPAPVPTPDPADAPGPATQPGERPGAADAPAPAPTPVPAPQEPPADAGPPAPQPGDPDTPAGRDAGAGAPAGTAEQPAETGTEPPPTGGAQKSPPRP